MDRVPLSPSTRSPDLADKTVIVVGAGLAGLSAAWWLVRFGVGRVIVLEARDRLGGRVRSLDQFTSERIIEAGGELIGLNHPLWLYFARTFGLGLSVITPEDDFAGAGLEMPIYLGGALLTPPEQMELFQEMTDALEEITRDAVDIDARMPWESPDAAHLDALTVADRLTELDISQQARQALTTQLANDQAVATERQSYLGLLSLVKGGGLMDYWEQSEVFRCAVGNQELAHRLADAIQKDAQGRVLCQKRVSAIDIHADGRTSTGAASVVVTASGQRLQGDYVVLAVPPSLWSNIEMTPRLPPDLQPQLGPAVKYLSEVRSRFWIREGLAPRGLSDELGETWEGTDNQMTLPGQGIELTVFAGGPDAAAAVQADHPADYFHPRIETLYPGYTESVRKTRFAAWPLEPYTRTGYSCPAPGQVTTVMPFLNAPYHERLFFAGEHTSTAFFGYMEGALDSGLRAALGILRATGVTPDVYSA